MTSIYGRGLYGANLFGATTERLTVVVTDNVTGEAATITVNFTVGGIAVTNPGPQHNTVGKPI